MAASRTPGATIPEELQREADRIQEQFSQLKIILNSAAADLGEMSQLMEPYDSSLASKITELGNIILDYAPKAEGIYDEVSNSLSTYAINLASSLDNLAHGIENLRNSVDAL